MTREENIATLNEHLEHWKRLLSEKICDQDEGEKTIDALQNAIKALEQEPCEVSQGLVKDSQGFSQEPCDDAVSRQAVIEAIEELKKIHFDRGVVLNKVRDRVLDLPSVTPQPKMGRWKAFTHSAYHGNDEDGEPIWREVTVYHCNLCNRRTVIKEKYCPNCGREMQGVEE